MILAASCRPESDAYTTWEVYQGDAGSNSYSRLSQINRGNVADLKVAWTYHSRDPDSLLTERSTSQANPILADGRLYLTSPGLVVIALNPATGAELWRFDPSPGERPPGVNRGVTYWSDGADHRIFVTAGPDLFALDARTGDRIASFGTGGRVDLRKGLGRDPERVRLMATSPGVAYEDRLILGSSTGEGRGASPGHIRAYDVRTGEQEWIFHTIPAPGEFGSDTWGEGAWTNSGGANNWAGMSLDRERGIVFVPTGSPSPQLIGVDERRGRNLFGNCLLALDARTGERVWHYQIVHHDLWDYDLPSPPNLVTVEHDGRRVDAVVQATKQGSLFIFDRDTGEPLFPVEERPVPPSTIAGETAWETQPYPTRPEPFTRQHITEEDLTNLSPEARAHALERFRELRYEGQFTPVGERETLFYPGTQGGAEWGGASFDPETDILYLNANDFGYIFSLERMAPETPADEPRPVGQRVFQTNCAACHGSSGRNASAEFPSLAQLDDRYTEAQVRSIVARGRGRMPGFPQLSERELDALVGYLFDLPAAAGGGDSSAADSSRRQRPEYAVDIAYRLFQGPEGYPATKPPWGTLNAINLSTGEYVWRRPLGEYPELTARGIPPTGVHNLGGSIVTAGGLVFIAATKDEKFRAFDKATGEILWEYELPAGGYATPSTYSVDGRQYVVIAATGGSNIRTPRSDTFIAFALPDE